MAGKADAGGHEHRREASGKLERGERWLEDESIDASVGRKGACELDGIYIAAVYRNIHRHLPHCPISAGQLAHALLPGGIGEAHWICGLQVARDGDGVGGGPGGLAASLRAYSDMDAAGAAAIREQDAVSLRRGRPQAGSAQPEAMRRVLVDDLFRHWWPGRQRAHAPHSHANSYDSQRREERSAQ